MSDSQKIISNSAVKAASELANSPMGYWIGFGLFVLASSVGVNWDGHLHDRKGCVEVQAVSNFIFKVDTCTGEVVSLNNDGSESVSNKSSMQEVSVD